MAIRSVTTENIAEFVAGRPQTAELTTAEAVDKANADAPTLGKPVIKSGSEELGTGPEPQGSPQEPKKKPVQARIDELTREKHELDEAFQEEYESRLRLEGELKALKSLNAKPEVKEEPKELKPPDPSKYTDQSLYDKDLKAYQDQIIDARVEEKLRQQREADRAAAQIASMERRVAAAKKEIPDFVQVIQAADREQPVVPNHIKAAFMESELGPQLAYHLAKFPDEQKRIFALTPARALIELGKIETQYAPKGEEKKPPEEPPETTRAPAPMAKLKDSAVTNTTDLSKPMAYGEYKRARLEQIRGSGRRRH